MSLYDDVIALMSALRDKEPVWLTKPQGRLQESAWLNTDDTVYGVRSEYADEPLVVGSGKAFATLRQSAPSLSDRQIASWFVYRAESERWLDKGIPER